jgi:hypothetical protein
MRQGNKQHKHSPLLLVLLCVFYGVVVLESLAASPLFGSNGTAGAA